MELEFKHLIFLTVLCCSLRALAIGGAATTEELGYHRYKSELPVTFTGESKFDHAPVAEELNSIIHVLNTALPLSLFGIVLLILTYNTNPIGMGSMLVAIVLFCAASTKTIEAAEIIQSNTPISIEARVWWM